MNSDDVNPNIEALPEESQLVCQAKTGDANAFVQLYDAYVEGVYRFIYFRVINDAAAEDITSQVFRKAWEHLESYPIDSSTFVTWIYKIAKEQVMDYYKANLRTHTIDVDFLSVPADYGLNKEVQDLIKLEVMRNHLRFLTPEPKRNLVSRLIYGWTTNRNITQIITKLEDDIHSLQVNTLQTVAKFLEYLNLGREIKPSPTFNARTRLWLTQYLQFHVRPQRSSMLWRMSLAYTLLVAALLITGTAKAQSALPGDIFYGWKRTSEEAWRSLSPDPVGTDIFLANRRLNEWISVEKDPARNVSALNDYFNALTQLNSTGNAETRARILPVLKAHRQRLNDSGISTNQLDNYITVGTNPTTSVTDIQDSPIENVTTVKVPNNVPDAGSNPSSAAGPAPASEVPAPVIEAPSEVVPPPTVAPTEVAAPAVTDVPTLVSPAPTEVPTAAAPVAATDVPTAAAPAATDVSTTAAPPASPASTNAAPAATDVPSVAAPPATQPPGPDASPATQDPSLIVPPAPNAPSGSVNSVVPTDNPGAAPTSATP